MGLYDQLEEKYYHFLDSLEEKNIHVYNVVDVLEKNNIPSFPVVILVTLLAILLIGYAASQIVFSPQSVLTVDVIDGDQQPVVGQVVVVNFGTGSVEKITSDEGKAVFDLERNQSVTVSLKENEAFVSSSTLVTLDQDQESAIIRVQRKTAFFSANFTIVNYPNKQAITKNVAVHFSCSDADFEQDASFVNGSLLNTPDIPANCGSLQVSSTSGKIVNSPIDPSVENVVLELDESAINTGRLLVTVTDEVSQAALPDLTVTVSAADSSNTAQIGVTAENGVATLESLPSGLYHVHVSDGAGHFLPFNSTEPIEIKVGETTAFSAQLIASESIPLIVQVVSADGKPINRAQVELRKDDVLQGVAVFTNAQGTATLNTSKSITYEVRVDHPSYFIFTQGNIKPSATPLTVTLTSAEGVDATRVNVQVVDEQENPIAGAIVSMVDSSGNTAGSEESTGSNGDVTFERLTPGRYQVVTSVPGINGDTQSVDVKSRQVTDVKSVITVGSGVLKVKAVALNSSVTPANGLMDVLNAVDQQVLQQNIPLSSNGEGMVTIRANQTVVLRVKTTNFAPTFIGPFRVAKDTQVEVNVPLSEWSVTSTMVLTNVLANGEEVDLTTRQLSANQTYNVQYLVLLPQNSVYDKVVAHVRSDTLEGPLDHVMVEEDAASFSNPTINSLSQVQLGKSFSPPMGSGIDLAKTNTPPFKWLQFSWKNPEPGNYVISVPYTVLTQATIGSALELLNRLEGITKKGVERTPFDDRLGTTLNGTDKQGLYAQVTTNLFRVGVSNTCSQNVCANFKATDLTEQVAIVLSDDVQSEVGHEFQLSGTLLTQNGFASLPTSARILTPDSGLTNSASSIITGTSQTFSWTANNQNAIPIGVASENESFQFSTKIKTEKEGTSTFTLQLLQNERVVWEKIIRFVIKAGEPLTVDVLPKSIIAGANNEVLVIVKDSSDKPVSHALVSAVIDGVQTAHQVFTDSDGKGSFTLNDVSAGSQVIIRVQKPSFETFEQTFTVSNEVLLIEPNPLDVSFTADGNPSKTATLTLRNATSFPIQVTQIKMPLFQGYLAGRVTEQSLPVKIDPDGNAVVNIEFKLLNKGQTIVRPVAVTQNALITTQNTLTRTRFVQPYTINGSVGLNGFTDQSDCLSVAPGSWKIISTGELVSLSGEIANHCTVDQEAINLSQLQARLDWKNTNSIGSFSILSRGADAKGNVGLSNTFQPFSGTVAKNATIPFELTFNPSSVTSASSQAVIEIAGVNRTESEPQLITQKMNVDVSVNQLFSCLKVISTGRVEVVTNPTQLGLGLYPTGSQPNSSSGNSVPSYVVPEGPANFPDTSFRGGLVDPYNGNYRSPVNSSFTGALSTTASKAPGTTNQVSISNTCLIPVEISLVVPDTLTVNKNTFQVAPKGTDSFTVSSGYKAGSAEIIVLGRAAGSNNPNPTKIASIPVTIKTSSAASLGANCIALKTRVFAFSNLPGAAPAPGQVVNNCYQQGVRLMDGGNAIQLMDNGLSNYPQDFNPQPYYENYLQQPQMQQSGSFIQVPSEYQVSRPANYSGSSSGYSNSFIQTPSEFQGNTGQYGTQGYTSQPISPIANPNAPTVGLGTGVIVLNKSLQGNAEVVTFGIQRNSGYRTSPPVPVPVNSYQQQGPVAYIPTPPTAGGGQQTQVSNPATISVNFLDAYGNAQSKSFPVMLTDFISSTQQVYQVEQAGNPYLKDLQDCVSENLIKKTLDDEWFSDHCSKDNQENCNVGQDELDNVLLVDHEHCSATDEIQSIRPDRTEQNGINVTFSKTKTQSIGFTVDRAKLGEDASRTVRQELTLKITRPTVGKTQNVKVTVEFIVTRGSVTPVSSGTPQSKLLAPLCEVEPNKMITPRVQYDWQPSNWNIAAGNEVKYTCTQIIGTDSKGKQTGTTPEKNNNTYYCDGTQFAIEVNEKLNAFKERITFAQTQNDAMEDVTLKNKQVTILKENYYNLPNIYRFLKAQTVLDQKAYFVKENFEPLNRTLTAEQKKELVEIFGLSQADEDNLTETAANKQLELVKSLSFKLNNLEARKNEESVKIVNEDGWLYWNDGEKYKDLTAGMGEVKIVSKKDGKEIAASEFNKTETTKKDYYLTQSISNARTFLNNEVKNCLTDPTKNVSDITKAEDGIKANCLNGINTSSKSEDILKLAKLKLYAEFNLIIGIRNNDSITPATLRQVLDQGLARDSGNDITSAEYFRDINFNAFLMQDELSEDFFNDFKNAYTIDEEAALLKMGEDQLPVVFEDAGLHRVVLNYNWDSESLTIESTREKDQPKEFQDNPFYHWPLDGPLGLPNDIADLKNSDGTRIGYGAQLSIGALLERVSVGDYAAGKTLTLNQFEFEDDDKPLVSLNWETRVNLDNYSGAQLKGEVLHITPDGENYDVLFTPTDQVHLKAVIASGSRAGMDYGVFESSDYTPTEVITWVNGNKLQPTRTYNARENNLCGQTNNNDFTRSVQAIGTIEGIAYTPIDLGSKAQWRLRVECAQPSVNLTVQSVLDNLGSTREVEQTLRGVTDQTFELGGNSDELSWSDFVRNEAKNYCLVANGKDHQLSWRYVSGTN